MPRVSTDTPAGDTKNSNGEEVKQQNPEVQLIKLRKFASNQGYEVVSIYQDRASGSDPNRNQLEEVMKAAFRHEFDAILIVRLDRITRYLVNFLDLLDQLDARWYSAMNGLSVRGGTTGVRATKLE